MPCLESQSAVLESKALLDYSDDAPNCINHTPQPRFEGVGVVAWWQNIAHRYVNAEIGICIHLHSSYIAVESEPRDLVFVFQKSTGSHLHIRDGNADRVAENRGSLGSPGSNDMKLPMPVHAGPLVNHAECPIEIVGHEVGREVGSVVRLYLLDERPTLIREWSDLPGAAFEFAARGADGKLQLLMIGGRVLPRIKDGSIVDDVIQSGPQLIKKFAQLETEMRGEFAVPWNDLDVPCPVILHCTERLVHVFYDKFIPSVGKGVAVSYRAFDSIPTALEWDE
jgi:hypothetical protein